MAEVTKGGHGRVAGLDGSTSHSGRRWFITRLAHSDASPKVIMTLAGHRNLTTTQRNIDVRDEMMSWPSVGPVAFPDRTQGGHNRHHTCYPVLS